MNTPLPAVEILRPPLHRRALIWVASYGGALVWMILTFQLPAVSLWASLAWVAAPGALALTVSRAVRRRWWRWVVLWGLFFVTDPAAAPAVLALGMGWIVSDGIIADRSLAVAADSLHGPADLRAKPSSLERDPEANASGAMRLFRRGGRAA